MPTSVSRIEFINLLETVQPGLSTKDIFEQSSCYAFVNGWVITFNGEIACRIRTELPPELAGAVDAAPLLGVLYKFSEDDVELEITEKELVVIGKRRRAGIRMQAEVVLPIEQVEKPGAWVSLPEDFSAAVEIVQETAGSDKDQFITTVVHMAPEYMESTDRFQATRYQIDCGIKESFLVRGTALKHVVRFGMHKMAETPNWVHFRNKTGLIFSCRRFAEEYPNCDAVFNVRGEKAVLPKGAESAAELAAIFSGEDKDNDRVTVEMSPGRMRVRGEGSRGWARQDLKMEGYRGEPVSFRISPKLLGVVVKKYNECEIGPGKLKAHGEHWTYITALGKVGEEPKATKPEPADEPAPKKRKTVPDDSDETGDPF